jgi:winged helix-turn-helix DNA-binding protein
MSSYIQGYYSPSASELNIFEKETNRKIIDSIREAYPTGITALELADVTGLPIKTVYAQLRELCRESLVTELPKQHAGRGRLKSTDNGSARTGLQQRQRSRYIIEDTMGVYDSYTDSEEKKKIMPPGHVLYSNDFLYLWNRIIAKEDED